MFDGYIPVYQDTFNEHQVWRVNGVHNLTQFDFRRPLKTAGQMIHFSNDLHRLKWALPLTLF